MKTDKTGGIISGSNVCAAEIGGPTRLLKALLSMISLSFKIGDYHHPARDYF